MFNNNNSIAHAQTWVHTVERGKSREYPSQFYQMKFDSTKTFNFRLLCDHFLFDKHLVFHQNEHC